MRHNLSIQSLITAVSPEHYHNERQNEHCKAVVGDCMGRLERENMKKKRISKETENWILNHLGALMFLMMIYMFLHVIWFGYPIW